ncbi:hypothetical protein DFH07DRAFT_777107 [Mycena maculata]|uniref:SAM domain-containing protein n=1 Tax=Mycena maculata TaxID=230809 RepID=A0AAD7IIY6_9AGAR|nr:hypothetical protein DFH07DRAFT_777107 [Mycena maculata]
MFRRKNPRPNPLMQSADEAGRPANPGQGQTLRQPSAVQETVSPNTITGASNSTNDRPWFSGGQGGNGGPGNEKGGRGGPGHGNQMTVDQLNRVLPSANVRGGIGGEGGRGGIQGGSGGPGYGTTLVNPLWTFGKTDGVPPCLMAQFCRDYYLSDQIRTCLEEYGLGTTGALFEVDESELKAAGLKGGHIAEIRRALKQFVATYNLTKNIDLFQITIKRPGLNMPGGIRSADTATRQLPATSLTSAAAASEVLSAVHSMTFYMALHRHKWIIVTALKQRQQ